MNIKPRDYQILAVNEMVSRTVSAIDSGKPARNILQASVGLGKTVIMSLYYKKISELYPNIRLLILSHRDELVRQPLKYFDIPCGIIKAQEMEHGELVVSASVQTLAKRLDKFSPDRWDVIITDECHHAAASTYQKIYEYFKPTAHYGFSATVTRSDNVRLDNVYDEIIFERDMLWGIKNGYLCDIECKRVYLDFDLSSVKTTGGDYNVAQLDEALKGTEKGIVEAYKTYARGQTIIFCESVRQAQEITNLIGDEAFLITGNTDKEIRSQLLKDFQNKKYRCFVNVAIATEGYDNPSTETVIMASPTKSQTRFIQSVGRGMRLYEGKKNMLLIDICGTSNCGMITAPSLLGLDIEDIPLNKQKEVEGNLFDLEEIIEELSDCPDVWIKNTRTVDLWAKKNNIDTLKLNMFQMPDGRMVISLPERKKLIVPPMDLIGQCNPREIVGLSPELLNFGLEHYGESWKYQTAINACKAELERNYGSVSMIWDLKKTRSWGKLEPTEAQMKVLSRVCDEELPENLTRFEASQILNRLSNR